MWASNAVSNLGLPIRGIIDFQTINYIFEVLSLHYLVRANFVEHKINDNRLPIDASIYSY